MISAGSLRAQSAAPLPVSVAPGDPLIRYTGRFDTRDAEGPRFSFSGSSISVRFTGGAINAVLSGGQNRFEIILDGKSAGVLALHEGKGVYRVGENLPTNQPHTLELFQRTEAQFGTVQFFGFELENGRTLLALRPRPERRIEFIGDSITCGFGNEAQSERQHFSPDTENHYLAFGPLTARALNAEATAIAWSGGMLWDKGPTDRRVLPQIYPRTLPDQPKSTWDFSRWTPQVVVVNLGTNDFGGTLPDSEEWARQYRVFLAAIRAHYPEAHFFLCTGPMLGGDPLDALRRTVRAVADGERSAGFAKVHCLEFPAQRSEDGLGADYHPSLKTHRIMADLLTAAIRRELGW